jgi:phenylacetyl-CoA:acceptor oxidoreductase
VIDEVAGNLKGHRGVVINARRARELGIDEGDIIEVHSYVGKTQGPAVLREGIRPDTLLMIGQFNHWATPYAKDKKSPSMNPLLAMSMALTDATGSSAYLVRVGVGRVGAAA